MIAKTQQSRPTVSSEVHAKLLGFQEKSVVCRLPCLSFLIAPADSLDYVRSSVGVQDPGRHKDFLLNHTAPSDQFAFYELDGPFS